MAAGGVGSSRAWGGAAGGEGRGRDWDWDVDDDGWPYHELYARDDHERYSGGQGDGAGGSGRSGSKGGSVTGYDARAEAREVEREMAMWRQQMEALAHEELGGGSGGGAHGGGHGREDDPFWSFDDYADGLGFTA